MKREIVDLQEFVKEISETYGNRDVYRYLVEDKVVGKTFKEFERDVFAVSSWFVKAGWTGKHVAIIGSSSYNWVTTFLGIACSANVAIPIDKMLPAEEILNLLVMGDADAVFLSADHADLIPRIQNAQNKVQKVVCFADPAYEEILHTPHVQLPSIDPDALTEILFTSGTTGVSKGVMISQRNIVSNINEIYKLDYAQNLKHKPVVLSVLPIYHTFELTVDNLGVIYCGATVCFNDKMENIVANLKRFRPGVILVVPAIAEAFYKKVMDGIESGGNKTKFLLARKLSKVLSFFGIDARRFLFRSLLKKFGGRLTNVIVGGAALRAEVVSAFEDFGVNMYQGYGLTECAPLISANYPNVNRLNSVGKPVSYMDVQIREGEIVVKGPGVMLGYYKNPEATAESFTEDGYFCTGDLGRFDDDGYLYITGRSKNLIILSNGKNIYPEELEAHIMTIEGVRDVMVYESNGKIAAAVHPADVHDKAVLKNIKQKVKDINATLPSYKRVTTLNFVAREFPKTTTLKIKRKEAMQMIEQLVEKKNVPYVAPKTELQKKIVEAFEQVLGCKDMGIKDNFFDVGCDSLATFEVAAILGIQAQDIYEYPTTESLESAMLINQKESDKDKPEADVNAYIAHNANILWDRKVSCVLLTGATGFLGSHILRELLKRKLQVICLVRSEQRLESLLAYYFPKECKHFQYTTVIGDITTPRFGLGDGEYAKLVKDVDMVIHTAANVSHAGHYEDLERTNVFGTQNIIDFCREADAVLQHTSTASVNGSGTVEQRNPDATFDEFILDIGQNYAQNVYIHSKYKAEELVLLAREEGMKANIFRIGNLTWRMSDGKFQKNAQDNGFLDRFRGLLKVGMYSPELAQYPIDFTPVDECADAYVRLALHDHVNNIYNLYNPYLFSVDMLVKRFYWGVKKVSKETFEKALRRLISDKEVAVLSFYNAIASASKNIVTSNAFTVKELKKLGFRWSRIGIRYLHYAKKIQ